MPQRDERKVKTISADEDENCSRADSKVGDFWLAPQIWTAKRFLFVLFHFFAFQRGTFTSSLHFHKLMLKFSDFLLVERISCLSIIFMYSIEVKFFHRNRTSNSFFPKVITFYLTKGTWVQIYRFVHSTPRSGKRHCQRLMYFWWL